jgi:hypothetical protein
MRGGEGVVQQPRPPKHLANIVVGRLLPSRNAGPPSRLTWGETIGTLTKNGLLDTELVLDWLWVSGVWARVGRQP